MGGLSLRSRRGRFNVYFDLHGPKIGIGEFHHALIEVFLELVEASDGCRGAHFAIRGNEHHVDVPIVVIVHEFELVSRKQLI